MTRFRYVASRSGAAQVAGEIESPTRDEADRQLRAAGYDSVEIVAADNSQPDVAGPRWTARATAALVDQVSQLASDGLSLADGLRAAADESADRGSARAMRQLAEQLEQGQTLEDSLRRSSRSLPPYVQGLVLAAARTGRLGTTLHELSEQQRLVRESVMSVWQSVAYPLCVLTISLLLMLILPLLVVPEFKKMFGEMGLKLPAITMAVIAISDISVWLVHNVVIWLPLLVVGGWIILRVILPGLLGHGVARRVLYAAPGIGRLWQWTATAEFSHLLAVLLEAGLPLPEALRLTGAGLYDANYQDACRKMSVLAEQASSLSGCLDTAPGIPNSLLPLVRWGERTGEVADSLRTAAAMFIERVRLRSVLLRSIAPPMVFVVVLVVISLSVISLFLPLISLVTSLS